MTTALNALSVRNGLKTTQGVLNKQQSGVDAQEKANPLEPTFTEGQSNGTKSEIDQQNAAEPTDEKMKAAQQKTIATQQAVAKGVDVSQNIDKDEQNIPVVKKPDAPKQMSYAEIYKKIYGEGEETDAQRRKREKRERTNTIISSVGDGLRALANMYYATKGAKTVHDPSSDLTAGIAKRRQMMDEQREKNRTAWLNGYLKAQALDEEKRKNEASLAETVRYHDQLANNRDRVGNQKDRSLDQKDRALDLTKYKYESDADYKKLRLAIESALADGRISHWQAMEAIGRMNAETGRMRANKSGSSRTGSYTGEIDEYMDLMNKDPEGMKEAEREVRNMGMSTKTAAGRKAQKIAYKKKHGGANKGASSSANKGNGRTLKGIH